jgi:hypothetical protein
MAIANSYTITNTNSEAIIKIVADASNTASTLTIPLTGLALSSETIVSPVVSIKSLEWSLTGQLGVYRGTTVAETTLTHSLAGNGHMNQTTGWRADNQFSTQDIKIVFSASSYGTLYITLGKSGFKTTFNSEQTGYAG